MLSNMAHPCGFILFFVVALLGHTAPPVINAIIRNAAVTHK
jgi:hypothetical protein